MMANPGSNNLQPNELRVAAQMLNVKAVLTPDDLPPGTSLISDEKLIMMLRKSGYFAVCERGQIFTSNPRHTQMIQTLTNYLQRKGFPISEVKVIPTSQMVVRRILNVEAANESEESTGTSREQMTDAQMSLVEIVQMAYDRDSSDIHLEIRGDECSVQMRVDGMMQQVDRIRADRAMEMCQVAVNWESAKEGTTVSFTVSEPIDASFHVMLSEGHQKIRFASVPLVDGCVVVLRLLESSSSTNRLPTLEELGYLPEQWLLIERIASTPQGLVIVTGPTGSGKSTTLAVCMSMMPSEKAIYSYEDPIENVISNARQVPVNPKKESCNWVNLSKNSLRMDPDVIMYGELREEAVGDVIVTAASTGHLVLTTLHTNSAPGSVVRLNDLGISYHRIADPGFLRLLIFQRLVAKVCPDCAIPLSTYESEDEIENRMAMRLRIHFKDKPVQVRAKGTTCTTCRGSGLKGRTLVAEVVQVDQTGRSFIAKGDIAGWVNYLYAQGWRDIKHHAEQLVDKGEICPIFTQTTLGIDFTDEQSAESFSYADFAKIARSLIEENEQPEIKYVS